MEAKAIAIRVSSFGRNNRISFHFSVSKFFCLTSFCLSFRFGRGSAALGLLRLFAAKTPLGFRPSAFGFHRPPRHPLVQLLLRHFPTPRKALPRVPFLEPRIIRIGQWLAYDL